MHRVFETVQPEELIVGDVVKFNGALWRIVNFGAWAGPAIPGGRCEFITVECIDDCGVRPFKTGFCKQFARHPASGTWERETREADVDLRQFKAGTVVEDDERNCGTVVAIINPHKVRVRWHKGFAAIADVSDLRIVEEQGE